MTIHTLMLLLFLISLVFAVVRKLIYLAIIIIVIAFAYYTGIITALLQLIAPIIQVLFPRGAEFIRVLPVPVLF